MDSRFLVSRFHTTIPKYYVLQTLGDYRSPILGFHTPSTSLKDPQPSLTAESQLSLGNDFSGIYFRCTTRALTLTWCTQGGVDRRQVGAGPLSSNLLSQVTDPPKIVKADFTMLSENPRAGRESFDKSSAHGKFWPSHHSPARPPRLSPLWRLYWNFNTFTMLVGFWKRQIRPHTRTPEQSSRRTAKLSKVSCLENNLVLLGVVHYFKEWVR